MKLFLISVFTIITFIGCNNVTTQNVERKNIELENGEIHEVYYFETDTSVVYDHCDDCIFCNLQNPEGNPD